MKKLRKTNPQLLELIEKLRATYKQSKSKLWAALVETLEGPRQNYAEVNLSKLAKLTKPGDLVVIPGRVLGCGDLSHQLTIAALGFSRPAKKKLEALGAKLMSISELAEQNPQGSGIQLIK